MPNPLLDFINGGQPVQTPPATPMPNPSAVQSGNPLLDIINSGDQGMTNVPPPSIVLGTQPAAPQPAMPQAEDPSLLEKLGREVGLTARAGIKGIFTIPGIMSDAVGGIYNTGADLIQGRGNGFRFLPTQQALDNTMTAAGLPAPQNSGERIMQDVGTAIAGAGGMNLLGRALTGAVSPVTQAIGQTLMARPAVTAISGATGAGAAGAVREAGGGPGAQLAAALVGGAVPPLAVDVAPRAIARLLSGGASSQSIARNVDDFAAAGVTPTVGQATQSRTAQAAESALSRLPGGAGPMVAKAEDTASKVGAKVGELADNLAPNADATSAGMAIAQGVKGDDPSSFVNTFRATQEQLYNKLDQFIAADAPVSVSNTKQALADLNADIPGARAVSQFFKNGKIQGIEQALEADTAGSPASVHVYPQPPKASGGIMNAPVQQPPVQVQIPAGPPTNTLPFEAVKKLRTLVGRELENNSLVSDVPRSKWEALYAALSQDMGQAAQETGPGAAAAWQRANDYTRAGMQRLNLLRTAVDQQIPERIYQAATSGTREGATMLNATMKSIPLPQQKQVTAAFLNRMGQATPGAQNDTGTAFSLQTFLSNWAKLSPEARQTLFNRPGYDQEFASNLDKIARVASNLREGSKVFANPSGTAQAVTMSGAMASALMALATGHPAPAAAIVGGAALSNGAARWLTSPGTVRWLANLGNKPAALLPAEINVLTQEAARSGDPVQKEIASELQQKFPQKKSLRDTISDAFDSQLTGAQAVAR